MTDIKNHTIPSIKDLMLKKLDLEINLLQKKVNDLIPPKKSRWQRIGAFFTTNAHRITSVVTQVTALVLLYTGVVNPLKNYISGERKSKIYNVNNDILSLADKDTLNKSKIILISSQDPEIVAPFLLTAFNSGDISPNNFSQVYKRMYEINTELPNNSISDKLLFSFMKSNKEILENELSKNAMIAFKKLSVDNKNDLQPRIQSYIDVIFNLNLDKKPDFKKACDSLENKCKTDPAYRNILLWLQNAS